MDDERELQAVPTSPRMSDAEVSATMKEPMINDSSRPATSTGTSLMSRHAHSYGEARARQVGLVAAAHVRCLRK